MTLEIVGGVEIGTEIVHEKNSPEGAEAIVRASRKIGIRKTPGSHKRHLKKKFSAKPLSCLIS